MSMKTVRFNSKEAEILNKVLVYYKKDFSSCIKELLVEKLEDLKDIQHIKRLKETKTKNYLTSKEMDKLFS